MMAVKARCADFTSGSLKALTPLLIASTPVIAVQPLEKALSKSQAPTAAVGRGNCGGVTTGKG